ncbi:MAG TPA: hypothetical protein VGS41_03810, partial [Chthonomonadales bacterium]|nr:hypothetical protein [Chthonomonadales bacterium]
AGGSGPCCRSVLLDLIDPAGIAEPPPPQPEAMRHAAQRIVMTAARLKLTPNRFIVLSPRERQWRCQGELSGNPV